MRIRAARFHEAEVLTEHCRRSKASWGYDAAFMAASAASLRVDFTAIERGRVFVAEDEAGALLGVASYEWLPATGAAELDLLFVAPGTMRKGVGRALLDRVVAAMTAARAKRLVILADPNAAGFYRRYGAAYLCDAPSDAIAGRSLPLFSLDLASGEAPGSSRSYA